MRFNELQEARLWKVAFGITLALSSVWAYAKTCPPQYQENWVAPQFKNATKVLNQAISAVDKALSAQLEINSQRLISAIAVLTKQKALVANQVADTSRTASQQVATGLNVLAQTERVKQARFDYGGEFGQGYSPCKVYSTRQVIANRDADMATERRARVMSEVVAAPGRYVDPTQGQRALVEAHKDFCTQDQVDSGLCKAVGAIPGASLTVATLFEPAMEGEKLYDAKVALVNNMVGMPDGPVPKAAVSTPAAAAYSLAKNRKDALISPAITSLKEIQLDYSGVTGTETGQDIPLAVHFRNEVKRYAGNSAEYDEWSRVMAAQNERGALIELLKIKALDLAIQEKQYRQYERMEAQLAALVALEVQSSGVQNQTAVAAERAAKQNVTNAIK
jgi:hypothetical protein